MSASSATYCTDHPKQNLGGLGGLAALAIDLLGCHRVAADGGGVEGAFANRDRNDEGAAVAEIGFDPGLASVALGDVLHERETDAASPHLLVGDRRTSHETIEDPTAFVRRYAVTLVDHSVLECALRLAHVDHHALALLCVLQGDVEEVHDEQ